MQSYHTQVKHDCFPSSPLLECRHKILLYNTLNDACNLPKMWMLDTYEHPFCLPRFSLRLQKRPLFWASPITGKQVASCLEFKNSQGKSESEQYEPRNRREALGCNGRNSKTPEDTIQNGRKHCYASHNPFFVEQSSKKEEKEHNLDRICSKS